MQALVCHPGKLVQQTQLLIDIWGPSHKEDTHYLRIVIASLGDNPSNPRDRDRNRLPLYRQISWAATQQPTLIETEAGIGYRFIGS